MRELHLVEIQLDLPNLLRFLRSQGLVRGAREPDLGYGVHAWLEAAFGEQAPGPWRLFSDRTRPPRLLGYSPVGAAELRRRMEAFAEPFVTAACAEDGIASRLVPTWSPGTRLGFEVQTCPVGRKARTGVEKDILLIRADHAEGELQRGEVYTEWLRQQLERDGALSVVGAYLAGFRLVNLLRRGRRGAGERASRYLRRPQALFRGDLVIRDPAAFRSLLARGVGRHKAFGYGMLLLRPAS